MQKILLVILLGAAVILGGAWWYQTQRAANPINEEALKEHFEWTFTDAGVDEMLAAPRTTVSLRISGVDVPVGTYTGSCATLEEAGYKPVEGELSGVVCWFAGGGTEIGVFSEDGALVLKQGDVDEGTAETPGFRGNFRPLVKSE